MPVFFYTCTRCKKPWRKLLEPNQAKVQQKCDCGAPLKRTPKPPDGQVKEVIDTGLANMPRRIERYTDIKELTHKRSHTDHSKADWQE